MKLANKFKGLILYPGSNPEYKAKRAVWNGTASDEDIELIRKKDTERIIQQSNE
jgi:hypothetical protein